MLYTCLYQYVFRYWYVSKPSFDGRFLYTRLFDFTIPSPWKSVARCPRHLTSEENHFAHPLR